jgi:hypothetical protein
VRTLCLASLLLFFGCTDGPLADGPAPSEATLLGSAAAPGCPTAPAAQVTWWRWTTQRRYASVVWSSDGTQLLVSESTWEAKRNLFTGYDDARTYCYRLSLFSPDGHKLGDVTPFQPGFVPGDDTSLADLSTPGYLIVHTQDLLQEGLFEAYRVALDGTRKRLTSASCGGPHVTPAPDGRQMALVQSLEDCSGPSGPLAGSSFRVSFFDADGNTTGGAATVSFAGFGEGTWTPAGDFVMTDGRTAQRIATDGTTASTSIPHCTRPATTSSDVAADGRIAGFDAAGNLAVVGQDPSRAFGCQ